MAARQPGQTDDFADEIQRLRDVLGQAIGSKRKLSAESLARELSTRLGRDKPLNPSTVWRWLEGKSSPPLALATQLKGLLLTLEGSVPGPSQPEWHADEVVADACRQARVHVLAQVLSLLPKRLALLEEVAFAVETVVMDFADLTKINERDAADTIRKVVIHALPAAETYQLMELERLEHSDQTGLPPFAHEMRRTPQSAVLLNVLDLVQRVRDVSDVGPRA